MDFQQAILLLQDPLKAVLKEMAGGDKVGCYYGIPIIGQFYLVENESHGNSDGCWRSIIKEHGCDSFLCGSFVQTDI